MEEKVIIKIEIEQEDARKQVVENTKALLTYKEEQRKLNEQYKANQKELEAYKQMQAALKKELDSGKLTTEQYGQATAKLNEQYAGVVQAQDAVVRQSVKIKEETKALTDDNRNLTKAMELSKTVDQEKAGSINQLRARLSELTKEYNSLSEEERENTKAGREIQKEAKKTSDELKKLEAAIGDNRRSVGDYAGGILKAADGTGKLSETIEKLKATYDALEGVLKLVKASVRSDAAAKNASAVAEAADTAATVANTTAKVANTTATEVNATVTGTAAAATITGTTATGAAAAATTVNTAALAGNVSMLKLLKVALAATGIGAVLLLLGGLVSWLTRTQEGLDWLSVKTKGITTVFGFLMDKLSDVGKSVISFFEGTKNLGDLLGRIGNLIKDQLIVRFQALGVILRGIMDFDGTKIADGLVQAVAGVENLSGKANTLKKEMREVANTAEAVEREFQKIRDAERALNVERAQSRSEVERYKLIAEDVTKSEKERADAARMALGMEQRLLDRQVKLQERRVNNIVAEQELTKNLTDDNDKLAEAEIKLAEIKGESFGKQTELQNKLNALNQESINKRKAAEKEAEERRKKATEKELREMKARAELWLEQAEKGSEAELEFRVNLLQVEKEIALKNTELTESERLLIVQKAQSGEIALRKEFAQKKLEEARKLLEAEKQQADAFRAQTDKEYSEQQKNTADFFAEQTLAISQQYAAGLIGEAQYNAEIERIKRDSLARQLQDAKDYGKSTTAIQQGIADDGIAQAQREAERKIQIKQAENQALLAAVDGLSSMLSLAAQTGEEAAEFEKAIALFQIAISTAQAIANIAKGAAALGANVAGMTGPAGAFLGPAAAASFYATQTAIVLGNMAQAKQLLSADAPNAPKFSQGGILDGPSHAQGGIQLYSPKGAYFGEAEGGEPILTAAVSRNPSLLAAASQINVAAGGAPLIPRSHMADGGIIRQGMAGLQNSDFAKQVAFELSKVVPRYIIAKQMAQELDRAAKVKQAGTLR